MKELLNQNKRLTGALIALFISGIAMSFQDSPIVPYKAPDLYATLSDTIPEKNKETMTMKEFDRATEEINRAMINANHEMMKLDMNKIQSQLDQSLNRVDMEKIMKDVKSSLKQLDIEKIMANVRSSLKDMDKDYVNADIEKALVEAHKGIEKANSELSNINSEEWQKEMVNVKKELERSKQEIRKIDVEKIMQEAKQGVEKAKIEMKLTKEMFNQMEKDGLINTKEGFSIQYQNKELIINGKKQPAEVRDRYLKYLKEDHFKINIEKEK